MRNLLILLALLLAVALLLAGCGSDGPPKRPPPTEVVVYRYRDLPDWATRTMPKPQRVDNTVGEHLRNENALDNGWDVLACHRALLRKLDAGEKVSEADCPKPVSPF